jgi:hypothetical protein
MFTRLGAANSDSPFFMVAGAEDAIWKSQHPKLKIGLAQFLK